jgi:DNA-directed RNA polymerase specialized sigma24 family protein
MRAVAEALAGMPRKQREAMVLRYLGGVPRAHIASLLRLPVERVDWLLADGQLAVARRLDAVLRQQ